MAMRWCGSLVRRMGNPETIEFLSFRRTFTLLIVLVVLPSAGLSGFGVVAIINERAAVEKRLETVWARRLAVAQDEIRAQLDTLVGTPTATGLLLDLKPSEPGAAPMTISEALFVVEDGETRTADARLGAFVAGLGQELAAVPERPVVFSIASTQGTLLVGAMRDHERVVGCRISMRAMEKLVARAGALVTAGDAASLALEPVQREVPQGLLARFVSNVSGVRDSALGPRELASVAMASPVQDFRLVAHALGEDPVAQASTRNRIALRRAAGGLLRDPGAGRHLHRAHALPRSAPLAAEDRLRLAGEPRAAHAAHLDSHVHRDAGDRAGQGPRRDADGARAAGQGDDPALGHDRVGARLGPRRERPQALPPRASAGGPSRRGGGQLVPNPPQMDARWTSSSNRPRGSRRCGSTSTPCSGALLNLLQNAFKYTGDDKRIVLRAVKDDGEVVFEVEDNGMGIPRREHKRVFDRFYRVDNLLTRTTEGSGLGLSIAQRIVQAHGGRITVDSTAGGGSTFRIHLPAAHL